MKKCLIAGGGAAGMMAAITAARNGNQVILFEKNEKLGLLQERAVVILRMQAIPRIFLTVSSPIASFYTARSTAFPIMIQWAFLMNWGWRLKLNAATVYSRNQTIPQMSSAHYSVR